MAIGFEEARRLARQRIDAEGGPPVVIDDSKTVTRDWGWVFFYNSPEYVATGDVTTSIPGCAPIFVNREDGSIAQFSTSRPFEASLAEYERQLASR